ncbi:hypothetical protein BDZ89DRAFT_752199 [Hymenopellis radicata]|nr:hypothetical protein BDZ89DRAFT_752199 [Hymenopellis radicata]
MSTKSTGVRKWPAHRFWHRVPTSKIDREVVYRNRNHEVIVAAGAIQSPALLQLSGVGDTNVLSSLSTTTRLNLKQVGKTLQEQTMNSLAANGNGFDFGGSGPTDAIAYPNIYEVVGSGAQALINRIK